MGVLLKILFITITLVFSLLYILSYNSYNNKKTALLSALNNKLNVFNKDEFKSLATARSTHTIFLWLSWGFLMITLYNLL